MLNNLRISRAIRVILFILLPALELWGQATQGSIFGTVTDTSGAAVPRATVTAISLERGTSRRTTTNDAGEYTLSDLELGSYTVVVEASGFKKTTNPPVTITVKARIELNTKLEVGQLSESVEVKTTSPLVRTGSAEVSNVLSRQELHELPILSRNLLTVASLTAGTSTGNASGRQAAISGAEIIVNGAPAEANNFIIDGVSDNMEFSGTIATLPPIDAVQEFAVQTSQYSAELGRSGGGIINIALKSGTNQFHGFAYDYFQNNALNARPYDFTGTDPAALALHRNQFGAGLGGPIKRNKLFFFGNYEGIRHPSSSLGGYIVPTIAEKTGDFTSAGFTVYDPETQQTDPANPSQIVRSPFPGNAIPSSRLNAAGAGLLGYFPNPNYVSPTPGVLTNYLLTTPGSQTSNSFNVKGDLDISPVDTLSAHVSQQRSVLAQDGWLPDDRLSSTTSENGDNAGVTYTRIIHPTLLNEARVSYNRFTLPAVLDNTENVMDQYDIPGWHTNPIGNGFPTLSITNISGPAPIREIQAFGPPFALVENTYQYLDTVSWTKGSHSIKFGVEWDHVREDRFQARSGGGVLYFNGTYTTQYVGQAVASPRNGVADALLGLSNELLTQYGFDAIRIRDYRIGSFIQDDWRATSRLTINLGLRWDVYSPYHEEQDRFANFDLATGTRLVPETARSVVQNTLGLPNGNLPAGWAYAPLDQVLPKQNWNDFSPRIGLAYAAGKNISVRLGYGLFYAPTTNNSFNNSGTEGNPFFFDFQENASVQTPLLVNNGFPSGGIESVLASPSFGAYYGPLDRKDPYSEKYSANIEWSPASGLLFDFGYAGQRALHFPTLVAGNTPPEPGPGSLVDRQPYPNVGFFWMYMPVNDSDYNALTISVTGNSLHGMGFLNSLSFKSAFTFSKATGYDTGTDGTLTDRWNLNYDHGLLDYDVTNRWVTSWVYPIPSGDLHGLSRALLGGWQASGILTLQSGFPFSVTDSGAPLNLGTIGGTGNRPDVIGEASIPTDQRTIYRWFNTAAFQNPAPYTFGNAGKNILRGPGLADLDFALQKRFSLPWEGHGITFRMEATNLFNRVQLGNPGASFGSSSFGIIQSLQSGPRQLQAVIRYEF